jgi:hypothetical protein
LTHSVASLWSTPDVSIFTVNILVIQITYSRIRTAIYKVDENIMVIESKLTVFILKTPVFYKLLLKFRVLFLI